MCMATRFRKVPNQMKQLTSLGIDASHIVYNVKRSELLKPLFLVVKDPERKCLVVIVRGTTSMRDLFTSLSGTTKPHHVMGGDGLVLGYSHFGMLAAARWIHRQVRPLLEEILTENPAWSLRLVGHSLGAGTAALLCMMYDSCCLMPQYKDAS
jgi:hypothetical protein